jgi:hypothetical protein
VAESLSRRRRAGRPAIVLPGALLAALVSLTGCHSDPAPATPTTTEPGTLASPACAPRSERGSPLRFTVPAGFINDKYADLYPGGAVALFKRAPGTLGWTTIGLYVRSGSNGASDRAILAEVFQTFVSQSHLEGVDDGPKVSGAARWGSERRSAISWTYTQPTPAGLGDSVRTVTLVLIKRERNNMVVAVQGVRGPATDQLLQSLLDSATFEPCPEDVP